VVLPLNFTVAPIKVSPVAASRIVPLMLNLRCAKAKQQIKFYTHTGNFNKEGIPNVRNTSAFS